MARRYAKGQIIVHFKTDVGRETAELLGKRFDLKLLEDEETEDGYVYETPIGKERETAKKFKKKYSEFIDSAYIRDILFEERYKKLNEIKDLAQELMEGDIGNTRAPATREFNASLDSLIEEIQKRKE